MHKGEQGFTIIELVTVTVLIAILSVTLFSRIGNFSSTAVNASRDDVIAALFFAQQTAMARSNIQLIITSNSVSVTENGAPIVVHNKGYPLTLASGVTATPATLSYDKLGRTTATTIGLSSTSGASASIVVEASGYAH
ncbi:Tfp pilus assembly protein FimT/FimU [Cellvibrio sp.]|uniref:pilus assembly FimT family protein n=1 Tax=Cellvibrio sp. TaxID=1965322 RepID=UPI0039647AB0